MKPVLNIVSMGYCYTEFCAEGKGMNLSNRLYILHRMVRTAAGIPRPRKEDLAPEEPEEEKYPSKKHEKKMGT